MIADDEAAVLGHLATLYDSSTSTWETVGVARIPDALPAMTPPHDFRRPVSLGDGIFVAGDHRDSSSIQGALVSGRRTAHAVLSLQRSPRMTTRRIMATSGGFVAGDRYTAPQPGEIDPPHAGAHRQGPTTPDLRHDRQRR